jgi:hypothetical protein
MIRAVARAVATAIIGALAGPVWLVLFYGWTSALRVDFNVDPPAALVQGAYPSERDPQTGTSFAWTAETLTITIDDIDRQLDYTLDVRVRGARGGGRPNPRVDFFVDGVQVMSHETSDDYVDVRVPIPAPPETHRLTIAMRSSATFVPGPQDKRELGVMIDRFTLRSATTAIPPGAAFQGVAFAAAAMGAALALLGVTAGSAIGGTVLVGAAIAAIVAKGFGPYTDFPAVAARGAMWTGLITVALTSAATAMRGRPFRNTARFAIAFSSAAFLAKLLILLHPDMPIGDTLFQAHRFQEVVAGRWFFTSIAPGNYHFPYAPGLYVAALPFAGVVRRGASDMTLLRTVVCATDVLAGLLLYQMAVRVRGERLAGAIAVALYQLIPLGFAVVATGNLTNAFAQSLAVVALALIASPWLRWEHRGAAASLTVVLLASFLSHTGAFAIGAVGSSLIALCFLWRGGPALRSPAAAVVAATGLAIAAAIVLYYAHFLETYRTELTRIGTETAANAPDAGQRGIGDRLAAVPRYLVLYYGVPVMVLCASGAMLLWRRGARDRVTLTCAGWLAGCLVFWIAGILTPVDMRHYLASIPAVAAFGAVGAAIAWTGARQRAAVLTLLGWTVFVGVHAWWTTLQ